MTQVDELKTAENSDGLGAGYAAQPQKVVFTPEQQEKVQALIDEAYKRAFSKAQKYRSSSEDVERLKTEVDKLRQDKKMAYLLRSISRHNVVDAEEVADLLNDRVRMDDDGGLSVAGDSGSGVIDGSGLPISVDEYVSRWLGERPHHLRTAAGAGAGSSGARFGAGRARYDLNDPSVWRNMPREDLDRLLKDGISVQGSAGQTYQFRDVKNPFLEARRRKFQTVNSSNG
ncbi:MAG: hypothetical protein HZB22_05290 [Deltaproteobacteria bacterium]|nr:hypothetical protein [Deltaproteobacteria bacterium]